MNEPATDLFAPFFDRLRSRSRALVFMDCDGVIFDTNRLKCDAFRYALEGAPPAAIEDLVAYHQRTGGVSRYLKIEHFYRNLFPVPEPAPFVLRALERFGAFCEDGYAHMHARAEALAFADIFGADRVYVVSGSDEAELQRVFAAHGIAQHFRAIHGSPTTKPEHIARILAAHGAAPDDALFVGDGGGDWAAAGPIGMPFVFLAEMSEWRDGAATITAAAKHAAPALVAPDWATLLAWARAIG